MFDPKKPVQTRKGDKARIVCTDVKSYGDEWPILALITHSNGCELLRQYTRLGRMGKVYDNDHDLVNVPEEHEAWINLYGGEGDSCYWYSTREVADQCAGTDRIACIKIKFKDGEGL